MRTDLPRLAFLLGQHVLFVTTDEAFLAAAITPLVLGLLSVAGIVLHTSGL